MKKLALAALVLTFTAAGVFAHEKGHEKGCDMGKAGQKISATGKLACKGDDDCTFQTADTKYTVCEMSKADLPKLSAAGNTITVSGKLITCEGKEKLLIQKVGE